MRNDYGALLEQWKVDLIVERARKKRIPRDELEDVQQEMVLAVAGFRHDPVKANGTSERAILATIIDMRLGSLCRRHTRQRRSLGEPGVDVYDDERQVAEDGSADRAALAEDVQAVLAELPPVEQNVCRLLAGDVGLRRTAAELSLSRAELDWCIANIREHFKSRGLDAWILD